MIAIGSDHAGYELKEKIKNFFDQQGLDYQDYGPDNQDSVDFPDYAKKVTSAIQNHQCQTGILICGTGIGMSIAANKVNGIRAALCTTIYQARMSKKHNDANVLVLAGRITAIDFSLEIVKEWVSTTFLEGKYQQRNDLIKEIEKINSGGKNHDI